jgi:hypothetical protein
MVPNPANIRLNILLCWAHFVVCGAGVTRPHCEAPERAPRHMPRVEAAARTSSLARREARVNRKRRGESGD